MHSSRTQAVLGGAAPFLALAVGLRVLWVLTVPTKPVGDFAMYLESAAHVVAHGGLDDQFVYMPGYVFLLAAVQALGGGWLAAKLLGAVIGGLGALPVFGLADVCWDRTAARGAALAYALWPAGIAVASVTGTDMPAAVFVGMAFLLLVRSRGAHWRRDAVLFGLGMGCAAWIRAVSVPLAVLAVPALRALGVPWRRALAGGAVSVGVALLVLSPWAVRNHARYGEWVFTDSHGGLTALVGANPDTDGRYTRTLNRMFAEVTGLRWLEEPHRDADKTAYALAKEWSRFEPTYALALLGTKADRLLGRERSLLYWPLYRAGVLPPDVAARWDARRTGLELLTDVFWVGLVLLSLAGAVLAAFGRRWLPLVLVLAQGAMAAVYVLFFAEPRYHLGIALLMFPLAGGVVTAAVQLRGMKAPWARAALVGLVPVALVLGFRLVVGWTEDIRDRHRWAVHTGKVEGRAAFVSWRRGQATPADLPSGLVGVHDGVGLVVPDAGLPAGAALQGVAELDLPAGTYTVSARVDAGGHGGPAPGAMALFEVAAEPPAVQVPLADLTAPNASAFVGQSRLLHPGGPFHLRLTLQAQDAPVPAGRSVWLSGLTVTRTAEAR